MVDYSPSFLEAGSWLSIQSHLPTTCMQFDLDCWWPWEEDIGRERWGWRASSTWPWGSHHPWWVLTFQCGCFRVIWVSCPYPLSCSVSKPNKLMDSLGELWPNHTSVCPLWQLWRREGHCLCLSQVRNSSNRGSCKSTEAGSSSGEQKVSRDGLGPHSFLSQLEQLSSFLAVLRALMGIALGARTEQQPRCVF